MLRWADGKAVPGSMIQDLHRVVQLIEGEWRSTRVLVVGDLMLDRYIWGDVERISPEAPVPVVRCGHRTERPGGAANVAMNLVGLGARAMLFGFCGDDADALALEKSLREAGVEVALTAVSSHPTTSKLRILSGKQQMLRLDTEQTDGYPADAYAALIGKVVVALETAQAVVLSDYAKGVLTEEVCQQVIRAASRRGIPVLVDPKQRDLTRYREQRRSARISPSWRLQLALYRRTWTRCWRPGRLWFRSWAWSAWWRR